MGVNGIYGLSGSGLDVESMVKAGMLSKQSQYDKMQQKFTKQQWQKEAFAEVYQDLTKFNYTTLSDYKLASSTNAKKATSNNSNITATANASAGSMSHKIEVSDVASNAYLLSTKSLDRIREGLNDDTGASEDSIKLQDVLFKKLAENVSGNANVTDASGNTYNDANGNAFSLNDTAFSITIGDGTKDSNGNAVTKTVSYTYQELYDGKTFNDLVSDINGLGLNVRATYDSTNDRFSFYNKQSGEDNKISISVSTNDENNNAVNSVAQETSQTFLKNLQILQSKDGNLLDSTGAVATLDSANNITSGTAFFSGSESSAEISGTNAGVKVDGITYSNLTSNKISVSGVTYEWAEATTASATVTVTQDTDKIVENVKKFVEDYNKMLSSLYEKYDEQKADGKYEPLTDTQKEGMKDEQIEKWEEKAKQGLLYHDSTIRKVIDTMRDAVSTRVEGVNSKYNSAYSIGISTTGLKGQLTLDEDKLKKALADDEDAAYNVLTKLEYKTDAKTVAGKTQEAADNYAGSGIAQRLADVMKDALSDVKDYAGTDGTKYDDDSDLGNLMKSLKEKMDNFKTMMEKFEEALYKKYDAMEVTLSQLGTQLSFITG